MPRKKGKKAFFKIKEKLVFVPPKKFLGKRVIGIICLICGSLILTVSLVYFYLIPSLFPFKSKVAEVRKTEEERPEFIPKRILVPRVGLDFPIEGVLVRTDPPLKNFVVHKGDEILILGQDLYRDFLITEVNVESGSNSSRLELLDNKLKLTLQTKVQPPGILIIEAEAVNEN